MRVAIIGPTGVLGRALLPVLIENEYTIRTLARSTAKVHNMFPEVSENAECDLLAVGIGDLVSMLEGCQTVVHIATAIPRDGTALHAWDLNTRLRTEGVRKLLGACLQVGTRRYIQQSITMAYPDNGDQWITEEMPLDSSPNRAQVCAPVIAMEQMLREIPREKLDWCILRGGSFVGPGTFQQDQIARLKAGHEQVPCDGSNFQSLVHVADVATAFVAAIEHAPAGSIFNVVDEPIRSGEYMDRLADSVRAPRPRRTGTFPCPPSWRCSNQAAKTVLGWQPGHGIIPNSP